MKSSTSHFCFDPDDKTQCFHQFCAENVQLSQDKRLASRQGSFRGLCFSATPLKPGFPFVVRVVETEAGWTGNLRVGLTTIDPSTLPLINSRDFIRESFLAPLPHQIAQTVALHSNDIASAICIYFKPMSDGFVQAFLIINEEHISLQAEPIRLTENKPIFAVVDLFGTSKTISVLPVKRSALRLSTICEQTICKTLTKSVDFLPLPSLLKQSINLRSSIGPIVTVI